MILNEFTEFDTAASAKVKRAFVGGKPQEKMKLDAGTRLYKFTEHPLYGPNGISPWWHVVKGIWLSNGSWVEGFCEPAIRARRLGISHRDYARYRSAVKRQWNTMDRTLWIALKEPVYGFAGRSLGQLEDDSVPGVYTIGGAWQLWIPNLTSDDVFEIPARG